MKWYSMSLVTKLLFGILQQDILLPDCSPLGLIRKSLQTKDVTWHG